MPKVINDKYYTPIDLANYIWDKTIEIIGENNISEIIEPSCGDGAFYHHPLYTPHFGYDIVPECEFHNVIKADFLTEPITYLSGRLCIGNPPYGNNNTLAVKFYKKCCEIGDYIAFILPISQYKNNLQMYQFDLIYSEDIGTQFYTDRELHCCFNIYKRPNDVDLNPKPNVKLKDITIIENRRVNGVMSKPIPIPYDYAMCNWGDSSLGKVPDYVGQYAQEVYFYCHNKKYKEQMLDLLKFDTIRAYVSSISMKKISVARLYLYLKENIKGIQ